MSATSNSQSQETTTPRPSTDTSRTLLAAEVCSIAPSETSTLRPDPQPYRGFPSEAAYFTALSEWAESKRYIQPTNNTLLGFYGDTSMEALASRPRMEFGISRKLKERKASKDANAATETTARSKSSMKVNWMLGLRKAS